MQHCLVYITAGSEEEALELGRVLVAEHLAACANIAGSIRSVFRWDGAVRDDGEVALIAKTRVSLVERLSERVSALHSYDCPCVVALPIIGGNPEFLAWIDAETAEAATSAGQ